MGLLAKLMGRESKKAEDAQIAAIVCPHATLTARWDSVQDMGDESKATEFVCAACQEHFSVEQAQELKTKLSTRLDDVG